MTKSEILLSPAWRKVVICTANRNDSHQIPNESTVYTHRQSLAYDKYLWQLLRDHVENPIEFFSNQNWFGLVLKAKIGTWSPSPRRNVRVTDYFDEFFDDFFSNFVAKVEFLGTPKQHKGWFLKILSNE